MKFYLCSFVALFYSFTSIAQKDFTPIDSSQYNNNFLSYISFNVQVVDFENSLNVNDFKTTEFQIENGFSYNFNNFINVSLGINGGVILGIPYEDRLQTYLNSGNVSNIDTFLQYYHEIDYIDQTLAKNRFYIGLHPQIGFNITKKWQIQAGTELRYYFQPFFEEGNVGSTVFISDGANYILLGNLRLNHLFSEQFSVGVNYDRGFSPIRETLIINSGGNTSYTSSLRYHSLGLNISYSF